MFHKIAKQILNRGRFEIFATYKIACIFISAWFFLCFPQFKHVYCSRRFILNLKCRLLSKNSSIRLENPGKCYSKPNPIQSKQWQSRLEKMHISWETHRAAFTVPKSKLSQKMTLRVVVRNLNCSTWWHLVHSHSRCLNRFFRRAVEKERIRKC